MVNEQLQFSKGIYRNVSIEIQYREGWSLLYAFAFVTESAKLVLSAFSVFM